MSRARKQSSLERVGESDSNGVPMVTYVIYRVPRQGVRVVGVGGCEGGGCSRV